MKNGLNRTKIFSNNWKRRILVYMFLFIVVTSLNVAVALAQVQSHNLSEIRVIDTSLDMHQYNVTNVSHLGMQFGHGYGVNISVIDEGTGYYYPFNLAGPNGMTKIIMGYVADGGLLFPSEYVGIRSYGFDYGVFGNGSVGVQGCYSGDCDNRYGYLGGNNYAVYGQYNSSNYGIIGTSNTGVYGEGESSGVKGVWRNDPGVYGTLGEGWTGVHGKGIWAGVQGDNSDINGDDYGVIGNANGAGGASHSGVSGSASGATNNYGLYGYASGAGSTTGVYGKGDSSGVKGVWSSDPGVYGTLGDQSKYGQHGVYGVGGSTYDYSTNLPLAGVIGEDGGLGDNINYDSDTFGGLGYYNGVAGSTERVHGVYGSSNGSLVNATGALAYVQTGASYASPAAGAYGRVQDYGNYSTGYLAFKQYKSNNDTFAVFGRYGELNNEQTYDTVYLTGGLAMYNRSTGHMAGAYGAYDNRTVWGALGYFNGNEPLAGYFEGNVNVTGNITAGTNTVFIDGTNSRVGIGTKSPAASLDVYGSSIFNLSNEVNRAFLVYDGATTNPIINLNTDGKIIAFDENSTDYKVGIGTDAPASRLSVGGAGKENATIYAHNNDSGTWSYGSYAESTGAGTYGIGTFANASNAFIPIGGMFVGSHPSDLGTVIGMYAIADPQVTTTNLPRAGYFEAKGTSGSDTVYGIDVDAQTANSVGSIYGINIDAHMTSGTTTGSVDGIYSSASDGKISVGGAFYASNGNAESRGVYGVASGAKYNYGGKFVATSGSDTRYGVYSEGATYDFYAAGTGINYGPFTGGHEVILDPLTADSMEKGMVVSVTGETKRRIDNGSIDISSTLPTVTLASKPQDKAVFGVFVQEYDLPANHWYNSSDERFGSVNALGEGRLLVTDINGEISVGDYITTSEVPGYGMLQDDDLLHSYTLAKATENPDWDSVTEFVEHNGVKYKVYLIAVVYTSG